MSDEIGRRNKAWAEFKDKVGCSIYEAERIAEDYDDAKMTLINKAGAILKAKWLDPSFGMFMMEGEDKFIMTEQVRKLGIELWVMSMVDKDGNSIPLRPSSENTPG